ncbi:pseudaminic acid cytidylyltransferase [Rheinheimera salexigens]|uniref:Pseudaminic acid cytidylyltransferase n=1 Tax=Rheinheimera salexigens TaxID=1628148 RepID=A0A1E7QAB5_9GAMM|nr:pseudaminic acid cytidylyltransferase [Rheinheimera salexigens]
MKVAIIPARGGSKRIPRKNIKDFCGQPMLSWPITAAINSGLFERIIVSTDDSEIAAIAEQCGAEVPFIRPSSLADDHSATVPVIQDAITRLNLATSNQVCCIYPTAAFIQATVLQAAFELLQQTGADFVMPVTEFSCPLARALNLDLQGRLQLLQNENENSRTQDCATHYHDIGQFYLGTAAAWLSPKAFYAQDVRGLTVPRYLAHDIDTPEDWKYAELVFSQLTKLAKIAIAENEN